MDEEWEAEGPLPPGDEFPGCVPHRLEMESEGAGEADHGGAPKELPGLFVVLKA